MQTTEQRVAVRPVRVRLMCECGGEMFPTGQVKTVFPPKYVHFCERCGTKTDEKQPYPYIDYEEVVDETMVLRGGSLDDAIAKVITGLMDSAGEEVAERVVDDFAADLKRRFPNG